MYANQALCIYGLEIVESSVIINFTLDDDFDAGFDTQAKINTEQSNKQIPPNLIFIISSNKYTTLKNQHEILRIIVYNIIIFLLSVKGNF